MLHQSSYNFNFFHLYLESVEFIRRTLPPQIPLMEDPLIPMINVIVNAADARKATSISAFRISSVTEITTFMVIVEGKLKILIYRYVSTCRNCCDNQ